MSWCAVRVVGPAAARDAMAAWLVGRTGHAVQEEADGSLVGFAKTEQEGRALLAGLTRDFGTDASAELQPVPQVDWADRWRDGLSPRRIGRLTITRSWLATGYPADTVVVDPETAFGSGEHGSTRTALTLLDRHITPGIRVLDLGSGSGILAIAAAKLGAHSATGIEIDPEAMPVAERNAERNLVAGRVTFLLGDAATLAPLLGPVQVVVSNILRTANTAHLPVIAQSLAPDGIAIFAGMETPEREAFLGPLRTQGFSPIDEVLDEGWWGVAARRD